MESLKKKLITAGLIVIFVPGLFAFLHFLFEPVLESKERLIGAKKIELLREKELIAKKPDFESQWNKVSASIPKLTNSDEALNQWVKDLLAYAATENITFTKLEPQGVQKEKIKLYVAFQGDFRKFIHLLYYLLEKDPASKIETFSVKQDEETSMFAYEITMGKILI